MRKPDRASNAPLAAVLAEKIEDTEAVIAGGESFPFMRETARTLADAIPEARYRIQESRDEAIAPVMVEFFAG
ncbi:MAG TPA: hypothetical protein VJ827_03995 [Rubrobacter sp.]|nr:hypothetical protein [Rubrobacter sp.]